MFRDAPFRRPRRRLTEMFARHGIDAARLDFRNMLPPSGDPLSVYNDIDISLDSFPWSGHTTACESMWMGVPMVTLRGHDARRPDGREHDHPCRKAGVGGGGSRSIRRDRNRARRDLDGLAHAADAAGDMLASRLCDGVTFTREFEALLRKAWRTWCATPAN